uniref:Neprosin PEP catalytic domain-containing protein n=1 Tax=Chenopodium quinoa TaxID=63459 RepID=A0A803L9D8_CHEQI
MQNLEELQEQKSDGIELKDGGCPLKTVPILRSNPNSNVFKIQRGIPDTHCVALVHTNNPEERKFLGVAGELENYKPIVYPNQWSSTRIKILNQNDNIEVGWMVNPDVFQDNEAHLYASFVALALFKWLKTCLWAYPQLTTPNMEEHNMVGTYQLTSQVEWGGEISNPKQSFPPPEMGNGKKALYNPFYTASIMHASYVDWNYTNVLNPEDTHKVWDCEASYTVKDAGWKTEEFGRLMLYGGFNEV